MFVFFILLISTAIIKDFISEKYSHYKLYEKYDEIQKYIILYTSYGFHKNYTFLRLYWYVIKVLLFYLENASNSINIISI